MIQEPHRGVYEFLWSEHKYNLMAVSHTTFASMATRLGRRIKILSLLKKIGKSAFEERKENYRALLNAYMHIKPFNSRESQEKIVKAILENEKEAACLIYHNAIKNFERALPGCRYFFNPKYAINKFWDSQDTPGLWLCFGAFQVHLPTEHVFQRILRNNEIMAKEFIDILMQLKQGISHEKFKKLPTALIKDLRTNNMVAEPGEKSAFLNPRVRTELCTENAKAIEIESDLKYSALILEQLIDNSEYPPEHMGVCPQLGLFMEAEENLKATFFTKPKSYEIKASHTQLESLFKKRLTLDNGGN